MKESFSYLVTNLSDISVRDLKDLEALTVKYPYCQLAYSLIAKGYQVHYSEELTNEKIRQAAAHALSRNALRKILNGSFTNEVEVVNAGKFESVYLHKVLQETVSDPAETASPEKEKVQEGLYDKVLTDTELMINSVAQEEILLNDIVRRKELQKEIIDSFILKDPGLIRAQKNQQGAKEKQEDLSLLSTRLDKGIITESYAKILTMQGRNEKAIEVYEKLILKFPEKKSYFVTKIEELL